MQQWTYDPHLNQKVFLRDYGYTTQARLDEISRRVVIPHETGYYVGRRMEGGGIAEKEPTY